MKMTEEEILKINKLMIGDTAPHGSHGVDMDEIVPNIDLLGKVATELMCDLSAIANGYEDRPESSIKACGIKARYWIDFIKTEVLDLEENQ